MITYYVVQSFQVGHKGVLIPDDPREAAGERQAISTAFRLAQERAGAIAFSRTGDPATGDYDDAVILCTHGLVPGEVLETAVAG